jgi:hypothetical protein
MIDGSWEIPVCFGHSMGRRRLKNPWSWDMIREGHLPLFLWAIGTLSMIEKNHHSSQI